MILPAAFDTDGHDTPAQEFSGRSASAEKLARQIDAQNLVPLLQSHLMKCRISLQTGVGNQNIDRPKFLDAAGEHGCYLLLGGDISLIG